MSNIVELFQKLEAKNEGALIAYVMGGDPEPKYTPKIAEALIKGGIDILELGIPFSDPIADGPTIQAASVRALRAGTTPTIVLEIAKEIKKNHSIPVAVMTYYNPIFKMGPAKFFSMARSCNVDGAIIPDIPLEEAADYRKAAVAHGLDTIFLAAPSTTEERLRNIVNCSSGFLYLVSHFGVTGAKDTIDKSTFNLIKRVLPLTSGKVPLAVGFGISKPEHVKNIIKAGANGAIVGSVFVNIIGTNQGNLAKMLVKLEETARMLKEATLP